MAITTLYSLRSNLHFHDSSLHSHIVTLKLSSQFAPHLPSAQRTIRFHKPLQISPSFDSRIPFRNRLITACSLPDRSTFDSATKTAVIDPALEVKKKAMDVGPDLKGTSIFLVGMDSSIKTNLGKLLADVLRYCYFDSDSLVEEAAGGESAAKSFRETDEKGYRESETEVLKQLSSMGRLVVSAGDGAVQSSTNLSFLRYGISLWIDVPLDMIARGPREDGSELPTSETSSGSYSEVFTQLTASYEKLKDGYATADATISLQKIAYQLGYDYVDALTTEDLTMEVLKQLEKLTRLKKLMQEAGRPF